MPSGAIQSKLNSLLIRAGRGNPELVDVLQEIINETTRLGIAIDPPPMVNSRISIQTSNKPHTPSFFEYEFTRRNVILTWTPSTLEDFDMVYYEIRKGTSWDTATRILVTAERQVVLDPHLVGSHTYLLKSLSLDFQYSDQATSVTFVVSAVGKVSVSPITIDQNVLLYWDVPTSTFDIDHYEITRNGAFLFNVAGTFASLVELIKAVYIYGITPVDIAGNEGPESLVSVNVTGPPDFVLKNEFDSILSGTKVNTILVDEGLLLPINLTETWQSHFTTRSWTTIQNQIDANYPYFIQPTTTTASYKEVFDVGLIYPATLISISWNLSLLVGVVNISVSTRVSSDNVIWSSAQIGQNIFVEAVRYIEITVSFTGANDKALAIFYNFHVSVSVKQAMDSGRVNAIASDVNGTFVTFNTPFKDVDSITATVKTTTEHFITPIRFSDVPNPTGFAVFVYDSSGIRVSKTVEWKARGIV